MHILSHTPTHKPLFIYLFPYVIIHDYDTHITYFLILLLIILCAYYLFPYFIINNYDTSGVHQRSAPAVPPGAGRPQTVPARRRAARWHTCAWYALFS